LIGGPLAGFFYDFFGSYLAGSILGGGVILIGLVLLMLVPKPQQENSESKEIPAQLSQQESVQNLIPLEEENSEENSEGNTVTNLDFKENTVETLEIEDSSAV
jgi:hypothetical protein